MIKEECRDYLRHALDSLNTMRKILDDNEPESPMGFLEMAQDVQYQLSNAVMAALRPILEPGIDDFTGE